MNRYLLDTNILVFILSGDNDSLSNEVKTILSESYLLYTSSVSVVELLQLYRIGKVGTKFKNAEDIITTIEEDFYIEILPFTVQHAKVLSQIQVADGHNDPFDHSIISQAISEKFGLISSDRKFKEYTSQNLEFIYNKR